MAVTIRLTPREASLINELTRRTGRSKSFYIHAAVHAYLEDVDDARAADDAMKKFNADGRTSRPISHVIDELGITAADVHQGRAMNRAAIV